MRTGKKCFSCGWVAVLCRGPTPRSNERFSSRDVRITPVAINTDRKLAFVLLEFHRAAEKLLYCKGYDVAQWYDLKKLRRDRLYAYIQNSLM